MRSVRRSLASLDFTILHEIGHQWWGGTVGANSNDHTWMVEGLTNATAVLAQAEPFRDQLRRPRRSMPGSSGRISTCSIALATRVADVSIFDQPADSPLSTLAYGKGALGFLAIRNAIGHDAFIEALATYADSFRLGIADPDDLLAAFETASGQNLGDLWQFWFESAPNNRPMSKRLFRDHRLALNTMRPVTPVASDRCLAGPWSTRSLPDDPRTERR